MCTPSRPAANTRRRSEISGCPLLPRAAGEDPPYWSHINQGSQTRKNAYTGQPPYEIGHLCCARPTPPGGGTPSISLIPPRRLWVAGGDLRPSPSCSLRRRSPPAPRPARSQQGRGRGPSSRKRTVCSQSPAFHPDAPRETAAKLIEGGMSQRQAAKARAASLN